MIRLFGSFMKQALEKINCVSSELLKGFQRRFCSTGRRPKVDFVSRAVIAFPAVKCPASCFIRDQEEESPTATDSSASDSKDFCPERRGKGGYCLSYGFVCRVTCVMWKAIWSTPRLGMHACVCLLDRSAFSTDLDKKSGRGVYSGEKVWKFVWFSGEVHPVKL